MNGRADRRIDANAVWFASAAVVFAAYALVLRPGEARVAERMDEIARTTAQLRAGERLLASQPQLEAERRRLAAMLGRIDATDTTQLVARFVRDAARVAARHRALIVAIAASGTPPASAQPHKAASAGTTEATEATGATAGPECVATLDLTIEGRYADVLAALRELSSAHVLAAVDVASIARKSADASDPTVSAALHVVLERIDPDRTDVRARSV